jgi:putative addiction module killer protein
MYAHFNVQSVLNSHFRFVSARNPGDLLGCHGHFTSVAYKLRLTRLRSVRATDEFLAWLEGLRDVRARAKVLSRLDRLELGNPGDVAPIGAGVSEMRIHHGPGYRIYYVRQSDDFVILCGGDKSSQKQDSELAKRLAKEPED